MEVFVGCDHAGFELKQSFIKNYPHIQWHDRGCFNLDSVDYPDLAKLVCEDITNLKPSPDYDLVKHNYMGLLICGSGQGMTIKANKYPMIRAALCWMKEVSQLAREHNNANVLCLGSRLVNTQTAFEIFDTFITTPFAHGRHTQRVQKI